MIESMSSEFMRENAAIGRKFFDQHEEEEVRESTEFEQEVKKLRLLAHDS